MFALRSTYAARWKVLDFRKILGESEAGEKGGGQNEELHDVCLREDRVDVYVCRCLVRYDN